MNNIPGFNQTNKMIQDFLLNLPFPKIAAEENGGVIKVFI